MHIDVMEQRNKNLRICDKTIKLCNKAKKLHGWRLVICSRKAVKTIKRYREHRSRKERPENYNAAGAAFNELRDIIQEYWCDMPTGLGGSVRTPLENAVFDVLIDVSRVLGGFQKNSMK